jgi:hypothetical protein
VLPPGPIAAISEVARSLWRDGSLSPEYFYRSFQEAQELSLKTDSYVLQDVFALGKNNTLLPKHSLLSALLAAPFYGIFGDAGFWILQQLAILALVLSIYSLVRELTGDELPLTTVISLFFLTQTLLYSYQYSYDIHGAVLILGGLAVMQNRPIWGGVIMGLSLFVRPTHILIALPLLFAQYRQGLVLKNFAAAAAGMSVVVALFLFLNSLMWGSPFKIAYSCLPAFDRGVLVLSQHPAGFEVRSLMTGWGLKLFGKNGAITYNPALLLLPCVLWCLRGDPHRRWFGVILGTALLYSIYIFSYPMWDASHQGNRFLLPAVSLYLIPFIAVFGALERRLKRSSGN